MCSDQPCNALQPAPVAALLRTVTRLVITVVCVIHTPVSQAFRSDYAIGFEAEYSDNMALTENAEEDEIGLSLLLAFSLEHTSAAFDADVRALFDYANYLNNVFDDETLGSLRTDLEWRPLPGQFHWRLEDYFTQTALSAAAPETPDNRINTNAFATGPDIFFRLGPATTLETSLRRAEYYFEDTDVDSSRNIATVGWVRALRPSFDLSANVAYADTDFAEEINNDFKRIDYFVRADMRQGRSTLVADVGATRIDRDNEERLDGFLGRLGWVRQVGVNTQFYIEASGQYTDAGTDLLMAGARPFELDRSSEIVSGDIFFERRIEARYRRGTSERNWEVHALLRDEDYELLPLDRETYSARFLYHRGIAQSTYLNAHVLLRREDYLDTTQLNKDAEYRLGLERQLGRNLTARLDYIFNTRDSNLVGGDYDENRVLFLIYYGRTDPRAFR